MTQQPDFSDLGRRLQPLIWTTIETWHREESHLQSWEDVVPLLPSGDSIDRQIVRLQMINSFQWHEEDKSRDVDATDAIQAAVKRSIDASNARRVRNVDSLDEAIFKALDEAGLINPRATLQSESPGSIIDRITVLALKIYHVKEAIATARKMAAPDEEMATLNDRHHSLADQLVDLVGCLDRLLAEVQIGRTKLKLYRQVKVYRDPATGRMNTDLP